MLTELNPRAKGRLQLEGKGDYPLGYELTSLPGERSLIKESVLDSDFPHFACHFSTFEL